MTISDLTIRKVVTRGHLPKGALRVAASNSPYLLAEAYKSGNRATRRLALKKLCKLAKTGELP